MGHGASPQEPFCLKNKAEDAAQDLAYRYVIHAYEDARQKRPIKHEHGGTTVLTDGDEALRRAEELAREFPDGWVYIHLEYKGSV